MRTWALQQWGHRNVCVCVCGRDKFCVCVCVLGVATSCPQMPSGSPQIPVKASSMCLCLTGLLVSSSCSLRTVSVEPNWDPMNATQAQNAVNSLYISLNNPRSAKFGMTDNPGGKKQHYFILISFQTVCHFLLNYIPFVHTFLHFWPPKKVGIGKVGARNYLYFIFFSKFSC